MTDPCRFFGAHTASNELRERLPTFPKQTNGGILGTYDIAGSVTELLYQAYRIA
jgi:hypothetical protein